MQQLGGGVWGSVLQNMPLKELLLKTWNQAMQFVKPCDYWTILHE